EPAMIGEISLKELLRILNTMFQVEWDIQGTVLRLEHYKYWHSQTGVDATAWARRIEKMAQESLTEEIPRVERLVFSDVGHRDFVGRDIVYPSHCAVQDIEVDHSAGEVSTDMRFLVDHEVSGQSFSTKGFMMVSTS